MCDDCSRAEETKQSLEVQLEKTKKRSRLPLRTFRDSQKWTKWLVMFPVHEFEALTNYCKGQISESALLDKAGR